MGGSGGRMKGAGCRGQRGQGVGGSGGRMKGHVFIYM